MGINKFRLNYTELINDDEERDGEIGAVL